MPCFKTCREIHPGEYIDLIQLPSNNHVHYTIIDFNELDIGAYCHAKLSKQIM